MGRRIKTPEEIIGSLPRHFTREELREAQEFVDMEGLVDRVDYEDGAFMFTPHLLCKFKHFLKEKDGR